MPSRVAALTTVTTLCTLLSRNRRDEPTQAAGDGDRVAAPTPLAFPSSSSHMVRALRWHRRALGVVARRSFRDIGALSGTESGDGSRTTTSDATRPVRGSSASEASSERPRGSSRSMSSSPHPDSRGHSKSDASTVTQHDGDMFGKTELSFRDDLTFALAVLELLADGISAFASRAGDSSAATGRARKGASSSLVAGQPRAALVLQQLQEAAQALLPFQQVSEAPPVCEHLILC